MAANGYRHYRKTQFFRRPTLFPTAHGQPERQFVYFASVYFAEEHNVNAPTLRYNVDQAGPCSKLKILSFEGKTVGASTEYHIGREEKLDALLYMYENMEEMTPYFK